MRKTLRPALSNVSDNTGIINRTDCLADVNVEIHVTGGAAQSLRYQFAPKAFAMRFTDIHYFYH